VAVPTPFGALHRDGKVFCFTDARSGKIKRIRHEPRVELAPCTRRGAPLAPAVSGRARILEGAEAADIAAAFDELWTRQFGLMWRVGKGIERLRRMKRAAIEIVVT
jgi:PPOX class probable F420-dependent enzyme